MAYNSYSALVGTTQTDIFTATQSGMITAFVVSNASATSANCSVSLNINGQDFPLVPTTQFLYGTAVTYDLGKVFLNAGDKVRAISSVANTIQILVSFAENV